ncbi:MULTISPECIES: hypothetical protein [Halobacterium]|uniref:Uncharacterized protein n=2 Tax=Halobacterium salinarum TaxID=2242 RepID=A0A510N9D1_HALSA|nr:MULTISPECIES: hypothetical protein [Halobacterium]MBB6089519.1 hypothetical protein [Halobacterium salinarum]MCF2164269.1 hypothetical protein [Halobacterium salinarum]MCF2167056.1 hypothetical protein [Halobacterium salinarum]MCF2207252.1 hypothetical protein [Halobacterium salinarum]MCF2239110.1 hypothetical protein [Halobacterium salinarum]
MLRTRLLGVGLLASGLLHLFGANRLLDWAATAYDVGLDAEFTPGPTTAWRVRGVGVASLLAGAHLAYHGRVVPRNDGD